MGALVVFAIGSALAGAAQTMDQLIAARVVQAIGGGVLVPVGTAAAAHLFSGTARPRALGVVGALTFLGMAAGPVVGAAIIGSVHPEAALAAAGISGPLADVLQPAWRWVFYLNIPIAIVALTLAWAASPGWESPRRPGRVDVVGAAWFGLALITGLVGLTLIGSTETALTGLDPTTVTVGLMVVAVLASAIAVIHGLRRDDPFLDPRLFRSVSFSSAALVSLLTGYAFATAIIGGAVFVDRVLYGGPDQQRLALGALAGATAIGALVSGFVVRVVPLQVVAVGGLLLSIVGLAAMSSWTPESSIESVALGLGLFGFGFGLTVTPRSTAAVESAGRRAFGTASAVVTVARMLGMAVGLAILTAYGSTTIDRLYQQVYASPDAYLQFIPESLHDRPLRDPLVVNALEEWASREAASIMVGLFVVAAGVTAVAIPPGLALGGGRAGPGAYAGPRTGRERRDRSARRRRTRRRWPRHHRTRPRPLARRHRRCRPCRSCVTARSGARRNRAPSGWSRSMATPSTHWTGRPPSPDCPNCSTGRRHRSGSTSSPRPRPRPSRSARRSASTRSSSRTSSSRTSGPRSRRPRASSTSSSST